MITQETTKNELLSIHEDHRKDARPSTIQEEHKMLALIFDWDHFLSRCCLVHVEHALKWDRRRTDRCIRRLEENGFIEVSRFTCSTFGDERAYLSINITN